MALVRRYGWTPAQIRDMTYRDLLLLAEAWEAEPRPR